MQLDSECVEIILKSFFETTKELVKDNKFFPHALPIKFEEESVDVKDPIPLMFNDETEKISVLLDVGAACWFEDIVDVVTIFSGCGRKVDDLKKFKENYDTERPSLYPESMREEYFVLTYIDLIDEDFKTMFCKYKKNEGKIIFDELIFMDSKDVMSGVVEFVIHGWNLMDRFLHENSKD